MSDFIIQQGFPDDQRRRAAEIFYTAFRGKLVKVMRDDEKTIAILSEDFKPEFAMAALVDGTVVGIAGFKTEDGQLVNMTPRSMTRAFGFFIGWLKLLVMAFTERGLSKGELLMDGISVDESMRGQGVGGKLLDALFDYAEENGFETIRLDVIAGNDGARRLYERNGFVATKTEKLGIFSGLFGFDEATTMVKTIDKE